MTGECEGVLLLDETGVKFCETSGDRWLFRFGVGVIAAVVVGGDDVVFGSEKGSGLF